MFVGQAFVAVGFGRFPHVPTTDPDRATDSPRLPPVGVRYRCSACGNLTRFDVRVTRTTSSYHHYSVGGELEVEDVQVLAETVEDVACRWCGSSANVSALGDIDG